MSARRLVFAAVTALIVLVVVDVGPAFADAGTGSSADDVAERMGAAVVVASDGVTEVRDADVDADFRLLLPEGATCPGDSAHDQWRTQSFIVPSEVDVPTLRFADNDPVGDENWSLYGIDENPYVNELLPANTAPGEPGRIAAIRPLSFAIFPAGLLPPGRYRIGIACTYFDRFDSYWDTEIIVADSAGNDRPGFAWSVVAPSEDAVSISTSAGVGRSIAIAVALAAVAVAGIAAAWSHQRSNRRRPDPLDTTVNRPFT